MSAPKFPGGFEQIPELDRAVALDAGNGRLAVEIALREAVDDGLAKAGLVIEHVMRDADRLGDPAGIVDILARAAGTLTMGSGAVIVELQGNSKHIVALPFQESSNDGGIDAARHGNNDPRFGGISRKTERIEHHTIPEAPFKAAHGKTKNFLYALRGPISRAANNAKQCLLNHYGQIAADA